MKTYLRKIRFKKENMRGIDIKTYLKKIRLKKENMQKNRSHNMSKEDNIKTHLKRKKIKKENMEKIGIIICLKKKCKN